MASSEAATSRPFALCRRACAATGLRPGGLGIAVGVAVYAGFLAIELALGRRPIRFEGDFLDHSGEALITLLLCALIAYLIGASLRAAEEGPRAVRRARPLLRGSGAELDSLERDSWLRPTRLLRGAGLVGVLIALAVPLLEITPEAWEVYDWRHWTPESTWHRFLAPVVGWWMLRLVAVMLVDSLRISRLAARIASIDLLDPRPLQTFVGLGLSNALRVTGFVALFSFLLIDLERYAWMVSFVALLTVGCATAALVLPVRGVHRRLREAKKAELAALHAAIRGEPEALKDTALAGRTQTPSLADLIAYRELVAAVREWPFDAPTYTRFALYLLIPLGSWLGGAVVERVVDAILG